MIRPLLVAIQFLTVLPARVPGEITPRTMGRAMVWFPIVGLALGALLAGADLALRTLFPSTVAAALLLATWVLLTGGLHLDGFLDCCDGLLVAKPPEARLEILRDTHVGSFAVVGGICLLLVKFAALWELPLSSRTAALLVIPAVSRAAMVYAARGYPYARPGPGLGRLFRDGLRWRDVAIVGAIATTAAGLALGLVVGLALVAVAWVVTVGVAWPALHRLGGLTGDVYGAINELAEVGSLLILLIV